MGFPLPTSQSARKLIQHLLERFVFLFFSNVMEMQRKIWFFFLGDILLWVFCMCNGIVFLVLIWVLWKWEALPLNALWLSYSLFWYFLFTDIAVKDFSNGNTRFSTIQFVVIWIFISFLRKGKLENQIFTILLIVSRVVFKICDFVTVNDMNSLLC